MDGQLSSSHEICSSRVMAATRACNLWSLGRLVLNQGNTGAGGGLVSRPDSTPGMEVLVQPLEAFK
jgi:hypothetical protein